MLTVEWEIKRSMGTPRLTGNKGTTWLRFDQIADSLTKTRSTRRWSNPFKPLVAACVFGLDLKMLGCIFITNDFFF